MRLALLPWAVERRHLWPRSFRAGVRTMMLVASRLDRSETHTGLPPDAWLEALSFCGREWFPRVEDGVRAPGDGRKVAKIQCDWCGRAPMDARSGPSVLKECPCRLVRYCGKACSVAAWETHRKLCKKTRRARGNKK